MVERKKAWAFGQVRASSVKRPQKSMLLHPRLRFIEPQLASLVDEPPEGKHWIHEIKHDGFRIVARRINGVVRLQTKQGYRLRRTLSTDPGSYLAAQGFVDRHRRRGHVLQRRHA